MSQLQAQFKDKLAPQLMKDLGLDNAMAVPRVRKVVLNVGLGKSLTDKSFIDVAVDTLTRISGQKPVLTKAKKSISNFKIREGMVVGAKVTLRGERMYDFLERLVKLTLPNIRDFQGLNPKKGFDGNGNYILGIREHIAFPEIKSDEVEKLHGLEVSINTTAENDEQCLALLKSLGFPFKA